MKVIGLIGGMSWESTVEYYRLINTAVKERLGGFHSARCIVYSVDFAEIEHCQTQGNWQQAAEMLTVAARSLERAGADFILICTNTMHLVFDTVRDSVHTPLLHIIDAVEDELKRMGVRTVGLIGTRFTMEGDFYRGRLQRNGFTVLTPYGEDSGFVNSVIFNELCLGKIDPESKAGFRKIIGELSAHGAQAVVLGCTEIGLLVSQSDSTVPLLDTTRIHALKAVEYALQKPVPEFRPTLAGKAVARLRRIFSRFTSRAGRVEADPFSDTESK